jgi:quinol monooxygenase YgiN
MIRHIVILNFRKDERQDYLALMRETIPIVKEIPGVLSYEIFENQSHYTPNDVISLGIEIHFRDQKALDLFMAHPKHYEANALFEKHLANPPYMVLTHPI